MGRARNEVSAEDVNLFANETQFQNYIRNAATARGWRHYHTKDSRGSEKGFLDSHLLRERVIYAELKTGSKKPTDEQIEYMEALSRAGQEVYLWRPSMRKAIERILT